MGDKNVRCDFCNDYFEKNNIVDTGYEWDLLCHNAWRIRYSFFKPPFHQFNVCSGNKSNNDIFV